MRTNKELLKQKFTTMISFAEHCHQTSSEIIDILKESGEDYDYDALLDDVLYPIMDGNIANADEAFDALVEACPELEIGTD